MTQDEPYPLANLISPDLNFTRTGLDSEDIKHRTSKSPKYKSRSVGSTKKNTPSTRHQRWCFLGLRFVDVRGLSEREVFVLCRPGRLPTGLRSCAELQFLIGGVCEVTNCLMLVHCAETQSPAVRRWCAVMPCGDKISDDPVLVLCVGDAVTGFRSQLSDAFAHVGTAGYCAEYWLFGASVTCGNAVARCLVLFWCEDAVAGFAIFCPKEIEFRPPAVLIVAGCIG